MLVKHKKVEVLTISGRHSYHDISEEILTFINSVELQDGIVVISTPHTTCSLFFEETMHDTNFYGDEFLHVDINSLLDSLIPKMITEGQYKSPGPKHIEFGLSLASSDYPSEKWVMLNTDAHLKASIYGSNSMTLSVHNNKLLTGSLGRVYFVDWDHLRVRNRTIHMCAMGQGVSKHE